MTPHYLKKGILLAMSLFVFVAAVSVLSTPDEKKYGLPPIKLGVDLSGGFRLVLVMEGGENRPNDNSVGILEDNIKTIKARINAIGVDDVKIYSISQTSIVVELANKDLLSKVKSLISETVTISMYKATSKEDGIEVGASGIFRESDAIVTGSDVVSAMPSIDPETNTPQAVVQLSDSASKKMNNFTAHNIGEGMVIASMRTFYIDGRPYQEETLLSHATIESEFSNVFRVSGLSIEEATELSMHIATGTLKAPMVVISEKTMEPRLGSENIKKGSYSILLGLFLMFAYVWFLYREDSYKAILTISLNACLMVVAFSLIGVSVTLVGVIGVMLTLGMAIDANILVLEQRRAIPSGFPDHSFSDSMPSIFHGQTTTLISSLVMLSFGSIEIKGAAMSLVIGAISTVVSLVFVNAMIEKRDSAEVIS